VILDFLLVYQANGFLVLLFAAASRRLENAPKLMVPTISAGSRIARIKMRMIFFLASISSAKGFIADPAIEARSG
jgi:hypothetical protein